MVLHRFPCKSLDRIIFDRLFQIELIEIDITLPESRQWFDKYQYEIPVIHFNGQFLMKHLVDTKLLESTLVNWEREQKLSKWFSYKLIGSVFKAALRMRVIWLRTSLINTFCRQMHCTLYIHLFVLHYFDEFVYISFGQGAPFHSAWSSSRCDN